MMNKKQILRRIEWMLEHQTVANKDWFINEMETLLLSAASPEKFQKDFKEPLCPICNQPLDGSEERSMTSTGLYHTRCWLDHPEIVKQRRKEAGIIDLDSCVQTEKKEAK
jgi:hypothetical protein